MTRMIVSLTETEKFWLQRRSRETGESMAQVLRRGIRRLQEDEEESLHDALTATRGLWRKGDGLRYQQAIRGEWK